MQLFASRSVSFTCAVLLSCTSIRVFSGKVIHVLHDGEEGAKMFHRLAQLAIHADGLHVEMDAFFALIILFEGSLLKHCGASSDCVRILCVWFFEESARLFCPRCRSDGRSPICRASRSFLIPGRRTSSVLGRKRAA